MAEEGLTTPFENVVLKENQNIGLIYPVSGFKSFELFFFRVMRRYPLHRVYNSELSEIDADGTVDFNFLGATSIGSGDDILEVWNERPFRLLHFSFGVTPSEIWMYKSMPADTPETGWAYEIPSKVGDKFDYIPGYLSPFDKPTVAMETLLHYQMTCYLGLKNDADSAIRPSLRMLGAGYDTLQITSKAVIDRILGGKIPARFVTIGGLRMFTYSVPTNWEPPTTVSADVMERIMTGGG